MLLAENIPDLTRKIAVDLGTVSGILAIVASLQWAATVYLLDTYDKAINLARENGRELRCFSWARPACDLSHTGDIQLHISCFRSAGHGGDRGIANAVKTRPLTGMVDTTLAKETCGVAVVNSVK